MRSYIKKFFLWVTLLSLLSACTPVAPPADIEQQGQQGEDEEEEVLPSPEDFDVPLAVFRDVEEDVSRGRKNGYDILSIEFAGTFELENGTNTAAYRKGEDPGTVKLEVYFYEAAWKGDGEWETTKDWNRRPCLIYEVQTGEYRLKDSITIRRGDGNLEACVKAIYAPPEQSELGFRREGCPYWTYLGDDSVYFLDEKDAAVEERIGEYGAEDRHRSYQWEGFYAEIYQQVMNPIDFDRKVSLVLRAESPEYYTPRNIHVGSTEAELKEAYPEIRLEGDTDLQIYWAEETTGDWYWFDDTGKYSRWYYGGIFFLVEEGVVTGIHIRSWVD